MPSTYTSLHVHVIFSTRDRLPLIQAIWKERFQAFVGSVLMEREIVPVAIGGMPDHVHFLLRLKPIHALADVVRELKSVSSKWIRDQRLEPLFGWQEGYGAFNVGPGDVAAVVRYVMNQEQHHRKKSAEEEFREFVMRAGSSGGC